MECYLFQLLSIPLNKMVEFYDQDKPHMKHGLFEANEIDVLASKTAYFVDIFKAFIGLKLKTKEFLRIQQMQLTDVLSEEPGTEGIW